MQKQKFLYEYEKTTRKEIWEACLNDKAFRIKYFKTDFYAFSIYYFGENFITGIKDFHREIYKFCISEKSSVIIGFRESGKTAIVALIYVIYCIAYKKEDFILFMGYDLESAKDKVLNVSNFLRANSKFKGDYGLLFDDGTGKNNKQDINRQKTMSKFVSTNGVRVEGVSLKNMKRGKQLLNAEGQIIRPGLLIADDIDIEESVKNTNIISENEAKINSGVLKSIRGKAIFLGNIITEDGVIQRLEEAYKTNWNNTRIALIEDGEIKWKERYVWKEKEAKEINKAKYNNEKVVQSIEELSINQDSFNSDFLNIPRTIVGDPVFNHENIDKLDVLGPTKIFSINIDDTDGELHIFKQGFSVDYYDYCYIGLDLGGGDGLGSDYTDITGLDLKGNLLFRFRSNKFNYKKTAELLIVLYENFKIIPYKNSLGIENNYLGTCIFTELEAMKTIASIALFKRIYVGWVKEGRSVKRSTKKGWNTNQASKERLKEDLSSFINLGRIQIDELSKKEFKAWSKEEKNGKIIYTNNTIMSKHDDSVISYGIAIQMFLQFNQHIINKK